MTKRFLLTDIAEHAGHAAIGVLDYSAARIYAENLALALGCTTIPEVSKFVEAFMKSFKVRYK